MNIIIVSFVVVILIGGILAQRAFSERMDRFYGRRCTGRAWQERFPDVGKEEIRDFLKLFVESFALSSKRKLSFAPNDKIMDVYRAINPQIRGADALECETLVAACDERYGVDITRDFSDNTTLADVFCVIRRRI